MMTELWPFLYFHTKDENIVILPLKINVVVGTVNALKL